MSNPNYTEKDLTSAKEIIEIYNRTPEDKRPLLTAMTNAFLAGMEAQERLSEGTAKHAG